VAPLPRLVATDLDGTLLGPDSWVSRRTAYAVRRAVEAGVEVVAVNGRSHHTTVERMAPLEVVRHAVCSNGATRYDLAEDRLVASFAIEPGVVEVIVEGVRDGLAGVGFGFELSSGFVYDEAFLAQLPQLRARGHRPGLAPPALDGGDVLKVMIGHPQIRHDELLGRASELMPVEVSASTSGAPFIEVTAAGVDKAFGLASLCGELAVGPHEVLAFGDNLNDLPMLAWAGRSVAMGNAHPAVSATATHRTASHAADGVARFLEAVLEEAGRWTPTR
jgi:Cof subfamily protein (haloacid dehalogenase superfamily)